MAKLKTEEAQLFLEPNYAVASTVRADGCPQTTVVWVDYDGENVVFNTADTSRSTSGRRVEPAST